MQGIIDIHSHILPGLDDGASNMEETIAMLGIAYEQGIRKMVATPHYHLGRYESSITKKFKLYKFRTVYLDAEERKAALMGQNKMKGLLFKTDHDTRIIGSGPDGSRYGLGYFLRTLCLDEFYQYLKRGYEPGGYQTAYGR